MALDPLSAFSLACNILQAIEYGTKILTKTVEYRGATDGSLAEQRNLRDVFQTLKGLNADLMASQCIPPSCSDAKGVMSAQARLVAANEECLRLSDEFINLLDRLKVNNRHSTLESVHMSIKSMWYRERLSGLKSAIAEARDNLNIALLVFMQHNIATMHDNILQSNSEIKSRIVNTFAVASSSMDDDINTLTSQLSHTALGSSPTESIEQSIAMFRSANQEMLKLLSEKLDAIFAEHNMANMVEQQSRRSAEESATQQKILDSLHFPRIYERREAISQAHANTYEWILQPMMGDSFAAWASSNEEDQKIYWIRGKPGSGKSTLMRFLDERLDDHSYFMPWAEPKKIIVAKYFFWNPGTPLQKSWNGLLRSLLLQLFEYAPELISKCVWSSRWRSAQSSGTRTKDWSATELVQAITDFVKEGVPHVFFLVDGLDEFEGTDDQREELISLLHELATFRNVKLCLSSRPWNVFHDAVENCPQLRLEYLTQEDIKRFVLERLGNQRRFQQLMSQSPQSATSLVERVVLKASGVFLWVKLVVCELLKALRDGDNIRELHEKVKQVPADLDGYFTSLMDSIEPRYRREASIILQIALHKEVDFVPAHPLRLLDLSFIEERSPDFALNPEYGSGGFDIDDMARVKFRLDSAMRRLNSRCLGLCKKPLKPWMRSLTPGVVVEYRFLNGLTERLLHETLSTASRVAKSWAECADIIPSSHNYQLNQTRVDNDEDASTSKWSTDFTYAFDWHVDFLHKSFHDFLLTDTIQRKLHEYSGGPYNARMFLCNARIAQMRALTATPMQRGLSVALASNIISAIAVDDWKRTPQCVWVAAQMKPLLEHLVLHDDVIQEGWLYISDSLETYDSEKSTFLTIAIDFDLSAYVEENLTSEAIREKRGRPILDYILCGRFFSPCQLNTFRITNQIPELKILCIALDLGADPNQRWGHFSVWADFLRLLIESHSFGSSEDGSLDYAAVEMIRGIETAQVEAINILLKRSASPLLPSSWMPKTTIAGMRTAWENAPAGSLVAVADILRALRPTYFCVGSELDECILLAERLVAVASSSAQAVA